MPETGILGARYQDPRKTSGLDDVKRKLSNLDDDRFFKVPSSCVPYGCDPLVQFHP